ncbi:MAG: cytochrome c oxidase subunit CcoM [Halopseudomonas sp.]
MYIDAAVIAGLITVALMLAFFGGVGMFIWSDIKKSKNKP